MQKYIVKLGLIVTLLLGLGGNTRADLVIDVTRGNINPIPVAIPLFLSNTEEEKDVAFGLLGIVKSDLRSSGLFNLAKKSAFIQTAESLHQEPRFGDWRLINVDAVVSGKVIVEGDKIRLILRIWDVVAQKQVASTTIEGSKSLWRRAGHKAADKIYQALLGETGYFDTRLVYVAEKRAGVKRIKQLALMDQDGHNHRFLTDGRQQVITPRLSPDGTSVVYMIYDRKGPQVYYMNLASGTRRSLGQFAGMTFAPRFSPDGRQVIFSQSKGGVSSIHTTDLGSGQTTRLTHDRSLDVSPCYSPDGSQIVFNSDRGGSPQIYIMNRDGSGVRRITHGQGTYTTPVWSPRGDYIAFTKSSGGTFYIGLIRPDGTGERMIASGYLVESPTWSPNGRFIAYTHEDRGAAPRLMMVDLTGHHRIPLKTPGGASDPAWSDLM